MSDTTDDELSKKAVSNEEELISEILSHQKIGDTANENDVSVCANCGKEGSNLNICNKCKEATYCNAACKKRHRSKHKKQCERRVTELHDEALFREPPHEHGDCPICFLRLPSMDTGRRYYECCGKMICSGCCFADVYDNQGKIIVEKSCPFCRTPDPSTDKEGIKRLKKRMEVGDAYAFALMGSCYTRGGMGLPQNSARGVKLLRKSGKFGYAYIGLAYDDGDGVERDTKMATHYYELAAMDGNVVSRYNLGVNEEIAGNFDRALKHYMIAVRGGHTKALIFIREMFMDGHATKDQYANALRSHQAYLNEIKSDQRDKAAAFHDDCSYY